MWPSDTLVTGSLAVPVTPQHLKQHPAPETPLYAFQVVYIIQLNKLLH